MTGVQTCALPIYLGLALREACLNVGGQGGGHAIAAGATIPPEKLDEFLKIFSKIIDKQIKNSGEK